MFNEVSYGNGLILYMEADRIYILFMDDQSYNLSYMYGYDINRDTKIKDLKRAKINYTAIE